MSEEKQDNYVYDGETSRVAGTRRATHGVSNYCTVNNASPRRT